MYDVVFIMIDKWTIEMFSIACEMTVIVRCCGYLVVVDSIVWVQLLSATMHQFSWNCDVQEADCQLVGVIGSHGSLAELTQLGIEELVRGDI